MLTPYPGKSHVRMQDVMAGAGHLEPSFSDLEIATPPAAAARRTDEWET